MVAQRKYWEPEIETAPREKIKEIQLKRLKALVRRAYEKTAYYRRRFDEVGIKPDDIQTIDDLRKLPFTEYTAEMPAADMLAIPLGEVAYLMTTGGTTGLPKLIYLSNKDSERWTSIYPRISVMLGLEDGDVIHPTMVFWLVPIGFAMAGPRVIPYTYTILSVDDEIKLMQRFEVTSLWSSPAQFLRIAKRAREMGIDLKKSKLRLAILAGEAWSQTYRRRMEEEFGMNGVGACCNRMSAAKRAAFLGRLTTYGDCRPR